MPVKSFTPKPPEIVEIEQYRRIAKIRTEIYAEFPRLYRVMDYVKVTFTRDVPTMAVGPKDDGTFELYINPDYAYQELTDDNVKGVLMHEMSHILFNHCTNRNPVIMETGPDVKVINEKGEQRLEKDKALKARIWNEACDMAINCYIADLLRDEYDNPIGVHANMRGFPDFKSAEEYYNDICQKGVKEITIPGGGVSTENNEKSKQTGNHDQWTDGPPDPTGTPEEREAKAQKAQEVGEELDKIAKECGIKQGDEPNGSENKGAGNGNATQRVKVDYSGIKKTPKWKSRVTHESVHGFDITTYLTRKWPHRVYGNLFAGRKRKEASNKLLIAVDVSGSINNELFNEFKKHVHGMQKHADFEIVYFNTAIIDKDGKQIWGGYDEKNSHNPMRVAHQFKSGEEWAMGGGTSFEPVITLWNKINGKFNSLLIFTDGEAAYETIPKKASNISWIIYNSHAIKMKHGKIYNMPLS